MNLTIAPELMRASLRWYEHSTYDHDVFYLKIRDGLPTGESHDGYSMACVMKIFQMAMFLCHPNRVLEIGFNIGISSKVFLELGATEVISIEIKDTEMVRAAERHLKEKYGDRFTLLCPNTVKTASPVGEFDMAYIDGSHDGDEVVFDIRFCKERKIKWLLFDDVWPHFGTVQNAMISEGVFPVAFMGNQAICLTALP